MVKAAQMVSIKVASQSTGLPIKRIRRWVRLWKLGRPEKDADGHFKVNMDRLTKYQAKMQQAKEAQDMKWEDEDNAE